MKEPMTDARRKQLYRIKKRKRRKQCIRVALRMAVLCFLVLFAVQKTADLLRVDDSDRMEDAEQGLHVPEKGKTFAGEVREETVAWSEPTSLITCSIGIR